MLGHIGGNPAGCRAHGLAERLPAGIPFDPTKSGSFLHIGSDTWRVMIYRNTLSHIKLQSSWIVPVNLDDFLLGFTPSQVQLISERSVVRIYPGPLNLRDFGGPMFAIYVR